MYSSTYSLFYRAFATLIFFVAIGYFSTLNTSAFTLDATEPSAADAAKIDNPQNHTWDSVVIEYISITPRMQVSEIGDGPTRPQGKATISVHIRNLSKSEAYTLVYFGNDNDVVEIGWVPGGETAIAERTVSSGTIPYGKTIEAKVYDMTSHKVNLTDSASMFDEHAMRVALVVDPDTLKSGDQQFGSFVRRMRKSFNDLHEVFETGTAPTDAGLERQPIRDRFRIDFVETVEFPDAIEIDTLPGLLQDHPNYDLVIACGEDGPVAGFWLPQYTIGHNFHHVDADGITHGIWSTWGENALWHEMLHFRGVPDYYVYNITKKMLPGRARKDIKLPKIYAQDLMNRPYQPVVIGALAAEVANSKFGISRVGACENPDQTFGHMWKWLPDKLKIEVKDTRGRTLNHATVSWYRASTKGMSSDNPIQGVAINREPDGTATPDADGFITIKGDYMGAEEPNDRSRWLLIEVQSITTTGKQQRQFQIVYGLWLNASYAAGNTEEATYQFIWK